MNKMPEFLQTQSRSRIFTALLLAVIGIFILRLFYLQVIRHDYYLEQADKSQVTKLTIQPERGKIMARDGDQVVPLVLNEAVYTVFADPHEVTEPDKITAAMREVAGGNTDNEGLGLLGDKDLRYVVLARQISRRQAELLKEKELDGLGFQEATRRVYPEGDLAAQTLGFVNLEGKGQYGVEQALNDQLSGVPGLLQAVTDVKRIPLTIGDNDIRKPAKDGDDIVLSIDRNIQSKAEEVLAKGLKDARATKGSMVVMDPNTGKVMAMVNMPSYDPRKYSEVTDQAVFANSVVADPYEAGSVIKALTVGAGLGVDAVAASSTFNNTNIIHVDGVPFTNVEEDPVLPNATMTDILEYSLNTGVVHILKQMGGGEVNEQARRTFYEFFTDKYRFGRVTGIEQAGEQEGYIPEPVGIVGANPQYATMSFGQGMNVTMIQTAAAFSASINGGTFFKPTVVDGVLSADGNLEQKEPKVVAKNVLSRQDSLELRDIIWQGRKQGFFGSYDPEGFKIGGKTGTSQVIDPVTGKYSDDIETGTYLGFGGVDTPRYVIMVRVLDPNVAGYAGTVAAGPMFNDMSNWMLQYLKLQPKT